jgi:hypothetical protein
LSGVAVNVQHDADEVFLAVLNFIQQQMDDKVLVGVSYTDHIHPHLNHTDHIDTDPHLNHNDHIHRDPLLNHTDHICTDPQLNHTTPTHKEAQE